MKKKIIILLLLLTLLPSTVFGADLLYRITHNDQDFLIIGEILEDKEDSIVFKVVDNIVSTSSLDESREIKELDVDEIELDKEDLDKFGFSKFKGDKYLLSVDESNGGYKIAWAIYEIDSLDKSNLNIVYDKSASDGEIIDLMAIKHFVNTDGQENDFFVDGSTLMSGDKVIYQGKEDQIENEAADIEDQDKEEKTEVGKESGLKRSLPFIVIILALLLAFRFFKKK